MPCDDLTHGHNSTPWPTTGPLDIEKCERHCGFCPSDKRHKAPILTELKRHVYTVHIDPVRGIGSHPSVWIKGYNGDVVKNARIKQRLSNAGRKADDSVFSPAVSVNHAVQVNGEVSASPAPSIGAFASGIDNDRRSVDSSIRSGPISNQSTQVGIEAGASTFNSTASLATTIVDDFNSFEASAFVEAAAEIASIPTLKRKRSTEDVEDLSDAALIREQKITEAYLEESRARLAHSRLILREMLIEQEQERRKELDL